MNIFHDITLFMHRNMDMDILETSGLLQTKEEVLTFIFEYNIRSYVADLLN